MAFKNIKSEKPVYVSPYILTGFEQEFEIKESESSYKRSDQPEFEVGLDVKYAVSDNLTLDVTVNTDFAQVEADEQQVNLT